MLPSTFLTLFALITATAHAIGPISPYIGIGIGISPVNQVGQVEQIGPRDHSTNLAPGNMVNIPFDAGSEATKPPSITSLTSAHSFSTDPTLPAETTPPPPTLLVTSTTLVTSTVLVSLVTSTSTSIFTTNTTSPHDPLLSSTTTSFPLSITDTTINTTPTTTASSSTTAQSTSPITLTTTSIPTSIPATATTPESPVHSAAGRKGSEASVAIVEVGVMLIVMDFVVMGGGVLWV